MPIMRTESDRVDNFPYSETILVGYKALCVALQRVLGEALQWLSLVVEPKLWFAAEMKRN